MQRDYLLEKHSVKVFGHSTSVTLEHIFWRYLKKIARRKGTSLQQLIESVDEGRSGNLSSTLRVFILKEVERRSHIDMFASFHE